MSISSFEDSRFRGIMIKSDVKQAVIFCGGIGTRLRPLTYEIPKPMAPINGRPFLEYLILQLKDNGISEILLLTGYKKEVIERYFGDGVKWGVKITYSHGETSWETAKRLYEVRNLLRDQFLLMYADNFCTLNLSKLVDYHTLKGSIGTITLFHREEKNNILIDDSGQVLEYDKERKIPHLQYVELGYMIATSKVLNFVDGSNVSFSEVIKKLTEEGELYGFVNPDQYYSISDMERLKLTEEYLKEKKIIIIDRDGVINIKAKKGEYITKWEDFRFVPGVLGFMEEMSKKGFSFIIVTNQAGISRGKLTPEDLEKIHDKMLEVMNAQDIRVLKIYCCPHHWEENCFCRKPNPGMFLQASKDFKFRLDHSYFIGDDERDSLAAYNSNCRSIMYSENYDKDYLNKYKLEHGCWPELFANEFNEVKEYLLKEELKEKR